MKPREYGLFLVSAERIVEVLPWGHVNIAKPKKWVHVIEYSAYESVLNKVNAIQGRAEENTQLREQNKIMRRALEFYTGNFNGRDGTKWRDDKFFIEDKFGATCSADGPGVAKEALAKCNRSEPTTVPERNWSATESEEAHQNNLRLEYENSPGTTTGAKDE